MTDVIWELRAGLISTMIPLCYIHIITERHVVLAGFSLPLLSLSLLSIRGDQFEMIKLFIGVATVHQSPLKKKTPNLLIKCRSRKIGDGV